MPLQIRRGTESERQQLTVPLAIGEPLYITDTGALWIGNGDPLTPAGIQAGGLTPEDAVDAVAAALVAGVNSNISFIYGPTQDLANRIDAVLDLSTVEGTISADGFKGSLLTDDSGVIVDAVTRNIIANNISAESLSINSLVLEDNISADLTGSVFADDSTLMIDATESSFNLLGTVNTDIVPKENNINDLGAADYRFKTLYLSNDGIYLGNAQIIGDPSGIIDLPAGSTVGGQSILSGVNLSGDLNVNIIGDDSSTIIDSSTRTINADIANFNFISGDLQGSVFGDDSSVIINGINKEITASLINTDIINIQNIPLTAITGTTNQLIIGNSLDPVEFRIIGDTNGTCLNISGITESLFSFNVQPVVKIDAYRGSADNPEILQDGDSLGAILFSGFDGNSFAIGGAMGCYVNEPIITPGQPFGAVLILGTTKGFNDNSFVTIDDEGSITTPQLKLGGLTTVNLPVTPPEGTIVFDSTTKEFKGWNGTAWVVLG